MEHNFLLEPISIRDLDNGLKGRNFWCYIKGKGAWSATGNSAWTQMERYGENKEETEVIIGRLWHKAIHKNKVLGISSEILNFCPATSEAVEIMQVTIKRRLWKS